MTSMAHIIAGDLVSLTSRSGRGHVRSAYGVVLDWTDHNYHGSLSVLVMVDGEQVWYDHRDMQRLNDHPGDSPSSRMRDDE